MPNFCSRRSRAVRGRPTVSAPSMRIDPASGRRRPRMHLTSTAWPVPEPPMMTRLSPLVQSISMPSSTRLRPNDFRRPRTEIFGTAASVIARRPSMPEERCGDQVIEYEDHHRGRNNGVGRRPPDPLRPAPRIVTVVATHKRDDKAECRRLYQARDHVGGLQVLMSAIEISLGIESEPVDPDEISAKDADDVGNKNYHRQREQPRDQARQHKVAQWVGRQGRQGIDLVGYAHRPDL